MGSVNSYFVLDQDSCKQHLNMASWFRLLINIFLDPPLQGKSTLRKQKLNGKKYSIIKL